MARATYTEILQQVWRDKPSTLPTLIIELSPVELKLRRTYAAKIDKFNKLGKSKILIIEDDRDRSIRYVFVSPTDERVNLNGDPVSMALFIMALKKMYGLSDYGSAMDYYHNLMSRPYNKTKNIINKIVLGLPSKVAALL